MRTSTHHTARAWLGRRRDARRLILLGAIAAAAGGCSRFVFREEPYTPDPAPVSEVITEGVDTTFVLRGPSYYLLARRREALWDREVVDDVAWRYGWLFGGPPPVVAIRLDTAAAPAPAATWRGLPLAHARDAGAEDEGRDRERGAGRSSRVGPRQSLAMRAAEVWVRSAAAGRDLPAWLEMGAVMLMTSPGAGERADGIVRSRLREAPPLDALFGVAWPEGSTVLDAVRVAEGERLTGRTSVQRAGRARPTATTGRFGGLVFVAQATSVLSFLRERDPRLVASLVGALADGRAMPEVLSTSSALPHDAAALDAAWRTWLRKRQRE